MFHLAASAHTNNWSAERTDQEFEEWLAKNDDLLDERSRKTARDEFRDMANHRLKGSLPKIRALTEQIMDAEPPGTRLRFQHVFIEICRKALKIGVGPAVQEIEQSLQRKQAMIEYPSQFRSRDWVLPIGWADGANGSTLPRCDRAL